LTLDRRSGIFTDQSVSKIVVTPTEELAAPHGTRQRRKDARPAELIDAALALFVEKGFANTRAEEVAARAGVSKGTLYLYYASKEELLKAVIRDRLSAEIEAGVALAERYEGPTPDLLREVFIDWWHRLLDSEVSGVFKIVITEVRSFPELAEFYAHEVIEPGTRLTANILRRGIERGELRAVDVPTAVHSLVLPMIMLCLHKHTLGACGCEAQGIDPRQFIRDHVDLMLQGLLVRPRAAAGRRP
jgi:AcrR family transcriptional regulator